MPIVNQSMLISMLGYVRPSQTEGDRLYVEFILKTINKLGLAYTLDNYGNVIVDLLPKVDNPNLAKIMFTSHTDTVHKVVEFADWQQMLHKDADDNLFLPQKSPSNCLGADDTTGNWLMLYMMMHRVPAYYVFFRDEEIGGLGSSYFVKQNADKLTSFTHCISFDRKGYDSIVTHQSGGRCCSDAFAKALGDAITLADSSKTLDYVADKGGTFTDSANFTAYISECTNLSVGYFNQHTKNEYQDLAFAETLAKALVKVDWLNLPSHREPKDHYFDYGYSYYDYGYKYPTDGSYSIDELAQVADDISLYGKAYAIELCYNEPDLVADLLVFLSK